MVRTVTIMKIATFNIDGFGPHRPHEPERPERIPALRDRLVSLRADILCLQEVNAQAETHRHGAPRTLDALDNLLAGTPYQAFHRAVSHGAETQGPMDVHNLVILSKHPIAARTQYWNDLVPPFSYPAVTASPESTAPTTHRWDRPILSALVRLDDGRDLHVFNLHLRAPLAAAIPGQKESAFVWKTTSGWAEGFFLAAMKRSGQALEARLAIDFILDRDPAALIAVCGDMNADLIEMPLRILTADIDDTGNPALSDRVLTPLEREVPAGDQFSVIHAGRKHLLDHILVSSALFQTCRHVEILNRGLHDEVWDAEDVTADTPSNHAPVIGEFNL